jgi:hypothetical protein
VEGTELQHKGFAGYTALEENPQSAGAEWIWNIANEHFPGATQMVALFMPASISGSWPENYTRMKMPSRDSG